MRGARAISFPALALVLAAPLCATLCATLCAPALAAEAPLALALPNAAAQTGHALTPLSSARLPIGPYAQQATEVIHAEGAVERTAWKIAAPGLTTLQIIAPLRDQLTEAGYEIAYECATEGCGGFDFRYTLDLLPEPDMHVDLGDFRYLTAQKGDEHLAIVVSRAPAAGFVHLTRVGAEPMSAPAVVTSTKAALRQDRTLTSDPLTRTVSLEKSLLSIGRAPLDDLAFDTGSASLAAQDYASLGALANFLRDHPDHTVMLVGHTDAEGSLSGNIALSRKRAQSVMNYLINEFGAMADQMSADGVGFLAPRASNLSDTGRDQNRRVEVVLTSTR